MTKKRILSIVLCLCMICSLLPVTAVAADERYTIDYRNETVTPESGYEILLDGTNWHTGTVTLEYDYNVGGFYFQIRQTGSTESGDDISLELPQKPGNLPTYPTAEGTKNGRITGVDTTMEYMGPITAEVAAISVAEAGADATATTEMQWNACTGTEITGLEPGDYCVRYSATDTQFASMPRYVTVRPTPPEGGFNLAEGYVAISKPYSGTYTGITIAHNGVEYETLSMDDNIRIYMEPGSAATSNSITISDFDANVTLSNISSTSGSNYVMGISDANPTLTLEGENKLSGGAHCGIWVRKYEENTSLTGLTIKGDGSLEVEVNGAGIYLGSDATALTVKGGTLDLTAGVAGIASTGAAINVEGGVVRTTISGDGSYSGNGSFSTGAGGIGVKNGIEENTAPVKITGGILELNGSTANQIKGSETTIQDAVVFTGTAGQVYGSPTIKTNFTIPASSTLNIPEGSTLTVGDGVTLTNNGIISGEGNLATEGSGKLYGNAPGNSGSTVTSSGALCGDFLVAGGTKDTDFSYADGVLTIKTNEPLTIATPGKTASSPSTGRIVVAENIENGANIALDGVHIQPSGSNALLANSTVTVTLTGQNTFATNGHNGFEAKGAITIGGSGALNVNSTGTNTIGINAAGDITISGGTVVANGNTAGMKCSDNHSIIINGSAKVAATGSMAHGNNGNLSYGIWSKGTMAIEGSATVTAAAHECGIQSYAAFSIGGTANVTGKGRNGIASSASLTITGGTVHGESTEEASCGEGYGISTFDGDLRISSATVTAMSKNSIGIYPSAYSSGTSSVLAITDSNVTANGYYAGLRGDDGITITGSTVKSESSADISIWAKDSALTINENSTVIADGYYAGLRGDDGITITSSTVKSESSNSPGIWARNSALTISDSSNVTAKGNKAGIRGDGGITFTNSTVSAESSDDVGIWARGCGLTVTGGQLTAKHTGNNNNKAAVLVSAVYNKNDELTSRGGDVAISGGAVVILEGPKGLTSYESGNLSITGKSTVTATCNGDEYSVGIDCENDININDSTVTTAVTNASAIGIYGKNVTLTNGSVTTTGGRTGIGSNVSTNIGGYAKVNTTAGEAALSSYGNIELGGYAEVIALGKLDTKALKITPPESLWGDLKVGSKESGESGAAPFVSDTIRSPLQAATEFDEAALEKLGEYNYLHYSIVQVAPAAPELENSTTTSITLKPVGDNANGAKAEYSKDGGQTWQDSPEFTGLSAGTSYTFVVRYAGTDALYASHASDSATFSTQRQPSGGGGYAPPTYKPEVEQTEGGDTTTTPKNPGRGDTVTVTPKPDDGYEVDKITVTDQNGKPVDVTSNPDGTFSFTQPAGKVKIEVTYKEKACDGDENCPSARFTDVDLSLWYHEALDYVVSHGLMAGTSTTTFSPDATTSRGMIVTILYRLAGSPDMESEIWGYPYADVDADAYYGTAAYWARLNGIASGYGNGNFGPDDPITREQLAVMLWRYAGSPAVPNLLLDFTDADKIDTWADNAMRWAVDQGVIGAMASLTPRGKLPEHRQRP